MVELIEQLKVLRNKSAMGHPEGWQLMRDTMDQAIKLVEEHSKQLMHHEEFCYQKHLTTTGNCHMNAECEECKEIWYASRKYK